VKSLQKVAWNSKSESPQDICEQCHDTGFCGDMGPGVRGNHEYGPCDCDPAARGRRELARKASKEAKP